MGPTSGRPKTAASNVDPASGELFVLAGLHETRNGADGLVETCTIVTTAANAALRHAQSPMPVIAQTRDYESRLRASAADTAPLLRARDLSHIALPRVSRAVNDARLDAPPPIEPDER